MVSDQVEHKTSCTATDLILQISEVDGLYYVYGENKDADQLRNYCAADMYHYFVHMQKGRFSLDSAHLYGINEQSQEKTCLFAYAQNNIKQYKLYLRYNDFKWHMFHNIE